MKSSVEKRLAIIHGCELMRHDCYGFPMLDCTFQYFEEDNKTRGSLHQGLGYIVTMDFVMKFMEVFDVLRLGDIDKQKCWVTNRNGSIVKIEPYKQKNGTTFDITKWQKEQKIGTASRA